MNHATATAAFAALGHDTRLDLMRLLIQAGPFGLPVGEVCGALGLAQSTVSTHLSTLLNAGLIGNRREGRVVRYFADPDGLRGLIGFLTNDCCAGRPELCLPPLSSPRTELERPMSDTTPEKTMNVLFLCTANSARSLMAEAILNREGLGKFRAFSAGSDPAAQAHPYTLELLANLNHPVEGLAAKSWDQFGAQDAPKMDFVFTVCDKAAAETCPVWPGQPMSAHWGLPDPVGAEGGEAERRVAFSETYRMLLRRISIFVNLPMESLDKLSLQRELDQIGQVTEG